MMKLELEWFFMILKACEVWSSQNNPWHHPCQGDTGTIHPLVLDTFRARAQEALGGDNAMNCALCKYRTQVLGFESEHGAPQASHHHHHEGLGESCTLCSEDCTGACEEDVKAKAHYHVHRH